VYGSWSVVAAVGDRKLFVPVDECVFRCLIRGADSRTKGPGWLFLFLACWAGRK